jgi:hypothetical protein
MADKGKVLNIRGVTEGTHELLREYAELSDLSQGKALKKALEIAVTFMVASNYAIEEEQ